MRCFFGLLFALCAVSPVAAEPIGPVLSGFYFGLDAGASFLNRDFSTSPGGSRLDADDWETGANVGVHLGYGAEFGSVYLGVQGDVNFADTGTFSREFRAAVPVYTGGSVGGDVLVGRPIGARIGERGRRSMPSSYAPSGLVAATATAGFSHALHETGSVRGRLGYDVGGLMPFLSGGLAVGKIETQVNVSINDGARTQTRSFNDDDYKFGYVLGGGIELPIAERVSLRGEYLFRDFGSHRVVIEDGNGNTVSSASFKTQAQDVRLGLSYHF